MSEPKAKILKESGTYDSLENLVAALGTDRDKRSNTKFVNSKMLNFDQDQLNALYRTDWLSGKTIDIIPNDMTREWRKFTGNIDPKVVEQIEKEEKRLRLKKYINQAHKWARLYGGSCLIMSIDDGGKPDEELKLNNIKKGGLRHIKAVDRTLLTPSNTIIDNPLNSNYGFPEYYQLNRATGVKIHHSRVLRFDGVELPFEQYQQNQYWHDSVLCRLYESIINSNIVSDSAASMVFETNVDIIKVKGFMNYLQTAQGEELLRKRFSLAKMLKSFNNMMLLDSEEEHENKTASFAGLPDLLDRYLQIVTAATDIPATRLLGRSAAGLNATGEGDLKNYYDMISSKQEDEYCPKLDYFDQIMFASLGIKDDQRQYEFNSLYQMSDTEQATLEKTRADRDQIYYNMNVITEDIIAKELKQAGTYTNITDEYIKELEAAVHETGEDDDTNILETKNSREEEQEEDDDSSNSEDTKKS